MDFLRDMRMHILALLAAALIGVLASGHAAFARDHILERAVFEDVEGEMSLEEAAARPFEPMSGILARGYTASAHWLRLAIEGREDGGELVLRIRPSYLDTVTLYEPDHDRPGEWLVRVTGDRVPHVERERASATLGFSIAPPAGVSTYYLRLETTSTSLLHVAALEPRAADIADLHTGVLQVIYFAMMLWILFWAVNERVIGRGRVVAWFAACQGIYLVYHVALMGYLAPLLPGAEWLSLDALTSFLVCLTPLVSLIFHRILVARFSPHRLAMGALDTLIVLDAIALGLLILGFTREALMLNALVVMLGAPMFVLLAATAREEAPPGLGFLRAVYYSQAGLLAIAMVPILGLVEASEWTLQATLVQGLISALLMFFFLFQRSRQLQKRSAEAALNLGLARKELEMERRQRDMQNRFMAMLTHELKNPLSVVRLTVGGLGTQGEPRRLIESALDNITAIIDRCSYADQVEQSQLQVSAEPCDLGAVLSECISRSPAPARVRVTGGPLPTVTSDRQLLDVLLGNLIDNALKYSAEGTEIDIRAAPETEAGRDGVGIAIENLPGRAGLPDPERAFEKFYRSSGAYRKSGSGLGLYVVRGVCELIGARIAYRAVSGKARFSLWVPC